MKPLNIAMPISSFLPNMGGMEVGLHNIASRLHKKGHKPTVILPFTQYRILKKEGYRLNYDLFPYLPKMSSLSLSSPRTAQRVYALYYKLFHHLKNIDVWHATMAYPEGTAIAQAFQNKHAPVIMRSAGADIQINDDVDYGLRRDPVINDLVCRWIPKLPAVIAITDTVAREYHALGIPDAHIHHIPNGVDTKRFRTHKTEQGIKSRLSIPDNHFVFLSVGRNHPKKNYKTLLEIAATLKNTRNDFSIVIVGAKTSDLQKRVNALGLTGHIKLVEQLGGASPDKLQLPAAELLDLYKSADAFVFPSQIETFGIAIIEAMAAGLPCLISDAPGCRDITENGKHALSAKPTDVKGFVQHMITIMDNEETRQSLSEKSLKRVQDYDWDSIVDRYENLYYQRLNI